MISIVSVIFIWLSCQNYSAFCCDDEIVTTSNSFLFLSRVIQKPRDCMPTEAVRSFSSLIWSGANSCIIVNQTNNSSVWTKFLLFRKKISSLNILQVWSGNCKIKFLPKGWIVSEKNILFLFFTWSKLEIIKEFWEKDIKVSSWLRNFISSHCPLFFLIFRIKIIEDNHKTS